MDLLGVTGNGQYPATQARDLSLGVFASSVACFNFDLARLGQLSATPPWTDATDDLVISSSCYKHGRSTVDSVSQVVSSKDPLVVDPYRIQIVQIKGECLDTDSTLDLVLTPDQPRCSSTTGEFSTNVDSLMRTIQQQSKRPSRHPPPSSVRDLTPPRSSSESETMQAEQYRREPKRRKPLQTYQCSEASCAKIFHQRTHLEIHERAHTGHKPFVRGTPHNASKKVSADTTHERRHTGEKPYSCEECGKSFSQRGNVRAHKIVHEGVKPFDCRLEHCGKRFTQLGNLKSHQNRFHAATLQDLNDKFASMREGDTVSATDKELWEYFATLYKHSNKGIKGRGKDRRISTADEEEPLTQPELQSEGQPENVGPYYGTLQTGAGEQGGRVGYPEDVYGDMRRLSASSFECSVDPYSPTDGYD
ncbi:MAG: hypothetical protein Q9181_001211 [Wetmoreana brouardii]